MAAQVGMAVVLLVAATLLVRSFWRLEDVRPGFDGASVTALDVSLPVAAYAEGDQVPFYAQLIERVRALPGVAAVGAVNILPLGGGYDSRGIQIEDHPRAEGEGDVATGALGHARLLRGDARAAGARPAVRTSATRPARRWWW